MALQLNTRLGRNLTQDASLLFLESELGLLMNDIERTTFVRGPHTVKVSYALDFVVVDSRFDPKPIGANGSLAYDPVDRAVSVKAVREVINRLVEGKNRAIYDSLDKLTLALALTYRFLLRTEVVVDIAYSNAEWFHQIVRVETASLR